MTLTVALPFFLPRDLPVWARLQLAAARVPVPQVTHWLQHAPGVIYAFTTTRGVLVLSQAHAYTTTAA